MASTATLKAIKSYYTTYLGRPADAAGLNYWASTIDSGAATLAQVKTSIQQSLEAKQYTAKQQITPYYKTYMGRTPDAKGLEYWANEVASGKATLAQVETAFKTSDEGKAYAAKVAAEKAAADKAAADKAAAEKAAALTKAKQSITPYYQTYFGRTPDAEGLDWWAQKVANGEATLAQVESSFKTSVEAKAYASVPAITEAYKTSLGRTPTADELNYWTTSVGNDQQTASQAIANIQKAPEAIAHNAEPTIIKAYKDFLGRDPDANGLQYWKDQIIAGKATPADVTQLIRNSDEAAPFRAIAENFQVLLGRDPSAEEFTYWQGQVNKNKLTPDQLFTTLKATDAAATYRIFESLYQTYLGRTPDAEGMKYWWKQINDGKLTDVSQLSNAIVQSPEAAPYRALSTAYQKYFGREPEAEGLKYWINEINSGKMSIADIDATFKQSAEGASYREIADAFNTYIGRAPDDAGMQFYLSKLKSGTSLEEIKNAIATSKEAQEFTTSKNPVSYFPDIYARDERGNLIENEDGTYQLAANAPQQLLDSISKMYQGILGRPASAAELNAYNIGDWYNGHVSLPQIQKDLLMSQEAQNRFAQGSGVWVTLTKNQTIQKTSFWGYTYEVTEPVTQPVYISGYVAQLPGAIRDIYNSADPQALVKQISADPTAWMKSKLEGYAATSGWLSKTAGVTSDLYTSANNAGYDGDTNAYLADLNKNLNATAEWLVKNGAMTSDAVQSTWNTSFQNSANTAQRNVLDQIHNDGGGFFSGEWLGDFLEKYEVPIMLAIAAPVMGAGFAAIAAGGLEAAAATAAIGSTFAADAAAVGIGFTGMSQTLLAQAITSGIMGVANTGQALGAGADWEKALKSGVLSSAGAFMGTQLTSTLAPSISKAIVDATGVTKTIADQLAGTVATSIGTSTGSGINAAVQGKDIGQAMLISGVSTAVGSVLAGLTGSGQVGNVAGGTATGMLAGKDFGTALQSSALQGALSLVSGLIRDGASATKEQLMSVFQNTFQAGEKVANWLSNATSDFTSNKKEGWTLDDYFAKEVNPDFDPAAYKKIYGLSSDENAGLHYLNTGMVQGNAVNMEQAAAIKATTKEALIYNYLDSVGINYSSPKLIAEISTKLDSLYGDNLQAWKDATPESVGDVLGYTPITSDMYDRAKSWTTIGLTDYRPSSSVFTMPAGMKYATQQDMAKAMAGTGSVYTAVDKSGNKVYMVKDSSYVAPKVYNPSTASLSPSASALNDMAALQTMTADEKVVFLAKMDAQTTKYLNDQLKSEAASEGKALANKFVTFINDNINNPTLRDTALKLAGSIGSTATMPGSFLTSFSNITGALTNIGAYIDIADIGNKGVALESFGNAIQQVTNAARSTEAQQSAAAFTGALKEANGALDSVQTFMSQIAKNGKEFMAGFVAQEVGEELIQQAFAVGGAGVGAGIGALVGGPAGAVTGATLGYKGVSSLGAFFENFQGGNDETKARTYDALISKGYSTADARQISDVMGGISGFVQGAISGGVEWMMSKSVTNTVISQVTGADTTLGKILSAPFKSAVAEFVAGIPEGALQGATTEGMVWLVDPSKANFATGATQGALWESFTGGPTAGIVTGISGAGSAAYDLLATAFAGNTQMKADIAAAGNNLAALGGVVDKWTPITLQGQDNPIASALVPVLLENNPQFAEGYSNVNAYIDAVKNEFGVYEPVVLANIANTIPKFADQITTLPEAIKLLTDGGLKNVTPQIAVDMGLVGIVDANKIKLLPTTISTINNNQNEINRTAIVDAYKNFLGETASTDDVNRYLEKLNNGQITLSDLKNELANSKKGVAYNEKIDSTIKDSYKKYLGREADAAGFAWWKSNVLNGNTSLVDIPYAFASSTEGKTYAPKRAAAESMFNQIGYKATEDEIYNTAKPNLTVESIANNAATIAAKSYFAAEGYTPSLAEITKYIGITNKADMARIITEYADPLVMTGAEARKYLTDLGYTTPTSAEVAQFTKQAKESDVLTALKSYVDNHNVTSSDARKLFEAIGYTPTEAEIAKYVGQGQDILKDNIKAQIKAYVDPRYIDIAEAKAAALKEGYLLTDEEAAKFVGQFDEATQTAKVTAYADPRFVMEAEAKQYFKDLNYTPTSAEIANYVGAKVEADIKSAIATYVDPRYVDVSEVKAAAKAEGYTLTDEEAAKYVGQYDEAKKLSEVTGYADAGAVLESEAVKYFKDLGYAPTAAELASYVGQKKESDIADAIAKYVDPRYITAAEVKAAAAIEGYSLTDAEVAKFAGQFDQKAQESQIRAYADPLYVLESEAKQYFADLNYTPTTKEIADYVGQRKEADIKAAIGAYVDPRYVDIGEVKSAALNEGYKLTDEEAAKYVGQYDEAKKLAEVTGYADPLAVLQTEAAKYFSDLGYTPTADELASYVGQKKESDVATAIEKYVDPRYATAAEIKAAAAKEGYTLSEKEIANFVGQKNQAEQEAAVQKYSDPLVMLADEARSYFSSENYTPTLEELKKYTGVVNEAETAKLIVAYADPLAMTNAEARKYMSDLGYTTPTDTEVALFTKQAKESDVKTALTTYVDNHQVTQAEVDGYTKSVGYVPSKDELKSYIQQGATTDQIKVMQLLSEYVDPRYVTASEVRAAYNALGFATPLDADVQRMVGQYAQSDLAGKVKTYLPSAIGNYTTNQIEGIRDSLTEEIRAAIAGIKFPPGLSVDDVTTAISDYMKANPGLSLDDVAGKITDAVKGLATTTDVEDAIANALSGYATQEGVETAIGDAQKAILDQMAAYEKAGIDRDTALDLAIAGVAQDLGTTKEALLGQIGAPAVADNPLTAENEATPATGIYAALSGVQTGLETTIADTQKALEDAIADAVASGLEGDAALQAAIDAVTTDLGTTKSELLTQLGTTETNLRTEFATQLGELQTGLETTLADNKQAILDQMAAYEKAGIDRDTALDLAITGVSQDLGTTKTDLLNQIGTTEEALRTEIGEAKTELSGEIQAVAEMVGKPASQVTAADIQMVKNMIAQQTATNLAYDVNQDGKVDIQDQTALETQLAVQTNPNIKTQVDPNTGLNVLVDTTTGQTVTEWNPATGTQWAPTGIYYLLTQQQKEQEQATKTATEKAKTATQKGQFGQLMSLLFSAPDAAGQTTTVKTPDPAKINYIYDFSSIFANPSQASMMPSPYGAMNTVMPMQPQQKQQAANQPLFQLASGFAEGGIVGGNDIQVGGGSIDDLLNILKGNG